VSSRVVFFGTPRFAVPTLEALDRSGRTPVRVVTQPARPVGRGRKLKEPPVAEWALERGIEVTQPKRVRAPSFLELAAADRPDVAVVVAFGQIFPQKLLDLPRLGCVNLHASLLPRYRGAAPIHAAIAAGDSRSGVSTMQMEAGLDSGPILLQRETEIGGRETTAELSERLAVLGAELMVETLEGLEAGEIEPRTQDHAQATLAPKLAREDGLVDWGSDATVVYARLRAFTPWPGSSSTLRGGPVKIVWGEPVEVEGEADARPGEILGVHDERLVVCCGGGSTFAIETLQRPGRRALGAAEFANGEHLSAGERFS
jgi:methionyl-tRNA formyltransferase